MANKNHPEWALKFKKKGTELRCIRGKYYLYEVSSKWDKNKRRPKKITGKYLGRITPEGLIPPKAESDKGKSAKPLAVKSYAGCDVFRQMADDWYGKLKEAFPASWKQLYAMAYIRLFHQSPVKRMPFYHEHSFLSEEFPGLAFSDKKISKILAETGLDQAAIDSFLRSFIDDNHLALIDATPIFTKSNNIYEAQIGYNNKRQWDPQMNLLYIYDYQLSLPLYYRLIQGNIREIKALKLTLEACGLKNGIIIGDKGFSSELNIEIINNSDLNYILPLRRNSVQIDYSSIASSSKENMDGFFLFKKRYIWYKEIKTDDSKLIIFLDEQLRVSEERDYLERIGKFPEEYTKQGFFDRQFKMGTLALRTSLGEMSATELFQTYKSRCEVEQLFDVYKNLLKADKTYMQSAESVRGWLFINHLAIMVYYRMYNLLKNKELLSKISVEDILTHLVHINKIKIGEQWQLQEIPKKTEILLNKCDINLNIT